HAFQTLFSLFSYALQNIFSLYSCFLQTQFSYNIVTGKTVTQDCIQSIEPYGWKRIIRHLSINVSDLDPYYDNDFTDISMTSVTFMRGNSLYKRPYGWYRIALRVTGKYDDGDDKWLGISKNSWPVSYHGTAKHNARTIAKDGYSLSKGKRFSYGRGIYSSPEIHIAEEYAEKFVFEGNTYVLVFQNRVNPARLQRFPVGNGEYWLSEKEEDIRPYRICIKR
ncbi:15032_t:CDS:1, partial [Dentiscutata heterogama]